MLPTFARYKTYSLLSFVRKSIGNLRHFFTITPSHPAHQASFHLTHPTQHNNLLLPLNSICIFLRQTTPPSPTIPNRRQKHIHQPLRNSLKLQPIKYSHNLPSIENIHIPCFNVLLPQRHHPNITRILLPWRKRLRFKKFETFPAMRDISERSRFIDIILRVDYESAEVAEVIDIEW